MAVLARSLGQKLASSQVEPRETVQCGLGVEPRYSGMGCGHLNWHSNHESKYLFLTIYISLEQGLENYSCETRL